MSKRGPKPKADSDLLKRRDVRMTDLQWKKAKALGNGNASVAIRELIDRENT